MAKKVGESGRNITWDYNHSIIRDSYVKLIQNLERKPTYPEIAKDTNLAHTTIEKHISILKFEPHKHPLRILTDDVILAIAGSARNGSSASQKLWFQIMEGWTEKQIMEHEGEINLNDARKKLIGKLTNKEKK